MQMMCSNVSMREPVGPEETDVFDNLWNSLKNHYSTKVARNPQKYERWLTVRHSIKQLLASWLIRVRNIHKMPIFIMRFSMNLLFVRCPLSLWSMLSHLRLCISYTKTLQLYDTCNSISIVHRLHWPVHRSVAVIGSDNMDYATRLATPRMNEDGIIQFSRYFRTINSWQRFIDPAKISTFDPFTDVMLPDLTDDNRTEQLACLQITKPDWSMWQQKRWINARHVQNSDGRSLLDYPSIPNQSKTELPKILFHEPLTNIGTASYEDMRTYLDWVWRKFLISGEFSLVVLFGDEQFVSRVWKLLSDRPTMWGNIMPFPGELHFEIHFCHAVFRLGGENYLMPLAEEMGYGYLYVNFTMKQWTHHDRFLLIVADCVTSWLCEILARSMKGIELADLRKLIKKNQNVSDLLFCVIICTLCSPVYS